MPPSSSDSRCGRTAAASAAPSTSSATSTAASTSSPACSVPSAGRSAPGPRGRWPATRKGARPFSSGTSSTAAPAPRRCCAWSWGWSRREPLYAFPATTTSSCCASCRGGDVKVSHGLAETLEQLEREPAGFAEEAAAFIGGLVSHYVLDGGELVVAHAGLEEALQGRASGRGARVRPLRRDHRGDRRVRTSGSLRLGRGLPRQGDGGVRPHPGAGAGVGEPHDQHRHRLRLRGQADGAALSRKGDRPGSGAAGLVRTGAAAADLRGGGWGASRGRPARYSATSSASGSFPPACTAGFPSAGRTPRPLSR